MSEMTLQGAPAGGEQRGEWLLDVLLRPERFFPESARSLSGALLVLCVLALGASDQFFHSRYLEGR